MVKKTLIPILLLMILVLSMGVSAGTSYCYQEQANSDPNNCGSDGGSYSYNGSYIYSTYEKPDNVISAKLLYKLGVDGIFNDTLPTACLTYDENYLYIRGWSYVNVGPYDEYWSRYDCQTGPSTWATIRYSTRFGYSSLSWTAATSNDSFDSNYNTGLVFIGGWQKCTSGACFQATVWEEGVYWNILDCPLCSLKQQQSVDVNISSISGVGCKVGTTSNSSNCDYLIDGNVNTATFLDKNELVSVYLDYGISDVVEFNNTKVAIYTSSTAYTETPYNSNCIQTNLTLELSNSGIFGSYQPSISCWNGTNYYYSIWTGSSEQNIYEIKLHLYQGSELVEIRSLKTSSCSNYTDAYNPTDGCCLGLGEVNPIDTIISDSYVCNGNNNNYSSYVCNGIDEFANLDENITYCGGCSECVATSSLCQTESGLSASVTTPANNTWYTADPNLDSTISSCYDGTDGTSCQYNLDGAGWTTFPCNTLHDLGVITASTAKDIPILVRGLDPTYSGVTTTSATNNFGVDKTNPAISISLAETTNPSYQFLVGTDVIYINTNQAGSFTVTATATDAHSGIQKVNFPNIATLTGGGDDSSSPYTNIYSWTAATSVTSDLRITTATDNAGLTNTDTFSIIEDDAPPTGMTITYDNGWSTSISKTITWSTASATDATSGLNSSSFKLERSEASVVNNDCGSFGSWSTISTTNDGTEAQSLTNGKCYKYRVALSDNVGNEGYSVNTNIIKIDTTSPTASKTAVTTGATPYTFGTWTTDPGVIVTVNCSELNSGSGCYQYAYCEDTANTCTPSTWNTFSVTGTENADVILPTVTNQGVSYIRYKVKDIAGKESSVDSGQIKIDSQDPIVTISNPNTNGQIFNSKTRAITYSATDAQPDTCSYVLTNGTTSTSGTTTCGSNQIIAGPWYERYNNLTIHMNDSEGRTAELSRTFWVDSILPVINLNSPSPTEAGIVDQFILNVTITEANLSSAYLILDSTPYLLTMSGSNNISYRTLSDGVHTYKVNATDIAGNNRITTLRTFNVDTTDPNVTIISPATNNNWYNSYISIVYSAVDTNLNQCSYFLNEASEVIVTCGNPITGVSWPEGLNNITVKATDVIGHSDNSSRTFKIDTIDPTGYVVYPNGTYAGAGIPVNFRVNNGGENGSAVDTTNTKLYVQSADLISEANCGAFGSWSVIGSLTCTFPVDENGYYDCNKNVVSTNLKCYKFRIDAYDLAGNQIYLTSANVTKTYSGGPEITITSPAPDTLYATDQNIVWTVEGTSLDSYWVNISNTDESIRVDLTENQTISGTNLYEGHNIITIYVNDTLGNTGNAQMELWLDTVAPTVTLVPPTMESGSYASDTIMINTSVNDTCLKNVIFQLYDNALNIIDQYQLNFTTCSPTGDSYDFTTSYYYEFDNLDVDTYSYRVRVSDQNSVVTTSSLETLVLDGSDPIITIKTPSSNGQWFSYNTDVLVQVTDDNLVGTCYYEINGGAQIPFVCTSGVDALISGISWIEGLNNITINASDILGNSVESVRTLYLDTVNPQITYTAETPANGSLIGGTFITVGANVTEANIDKIIIYLFDNNTDLVTSYQSNSLNFNYAFTGIPDGDYSFYAKAFDLASRTNQTERRYVALDGNPPVITITNPSTDGYLFSDDVNISYTVVDPSVDSCWISINGGANTTVTCEDDISYSWVEGRNNITIYANDSYGNTASKFRYINKDNTAPVINIITPSADNTSVYSDESEIPINIIFNDANLDSFYIRCYDNIAYTGDLEYSATITGLSEISGYPFTDIAIFNTEGTKYCRVTATDTINVAVKYFEFDVSPSQIINIEGKDLITGDSVIMDVTVTTNGVNTTYTGASEYNLTLPCTDTTITACSDNHLNCDINEITSCAEADYLVYFWESELNIEVRNSVSGNLVEDINFEIQINAVNYANSDNDGTYTLKEREGDYVIDISKENYHSLHVEGILNSKENKSLQLEINPIYNISFYREQTGTSFDFTESNTTYTCENGTQEIEDVEPQYDPNTVTCVGNFSSTHDCEDGYDGLDSTYAVAYTGETAEIELEFTKPLGVLNKTYFTFKKDILATNRYNLTDFPDCWSYSTSKVLFKLTSNESSGNTTIYCRNTGGWEEMDTLNNGGYIWYNEVNWVYDSSEISYTECSDLLEMSFSFKAFCEDKVISRTITSYNQNIEIDCPYSYWMITADYSTETYYRTLNPDKDNPTQEVFMLDLKEDQAVEIKLSVNDIGSDYVERGQIIVYKDIGTTKEKVIQQYLDIENKVILWLDLNQVYEICSIDDYGVESCHGILTADSSGSKTLNLPEIGLDYQGEYLERDLFWEIVPAKESGKATLYYYDYSNGTTNSVTWTIYNTATGDIIDQLVSTNEKVTQLQITDLSKYTSYWSVVQVDQSYYTRPLEESESLWSKSATHFPGFEESENLLKFLFAILVPLIILFLFSLSSMEWGMGISVILMWVFYGMDWYDYLASRVEGGTGWLLAVLIVYTILTSLAWLQRTGRVE